MGKCWCFCLACLLYGCLEGGLEGKAPEQGGVLRGSLLDVGQGLSLLFEGEQGYWLYDTGPDSAGLADTLAAYGVKELAGVVVSHWHRDHAGGFVELAESMREGRLRIGRLLYGPDTGGALWRDSALHECEKLGVPARQLSRGDTLGLALPFTARLLWPPAGEPLGGNPASLVLRLSDGQRGWLLAGDLEREQEERLLRMEPTLQALVLQVGHHGSRTSSSWAWLSTLQPEWALIGAGANNEFGHPHAESLSRLFALLPDSSRLRLNYGPGPRTLQWNHGYAPFLAP